MSVWLPRRALLITRSSGYRRNLAHISTRSKLVAANLVVLSDRRQHGGTFNFSTSIRRAEDKASAPVTKDDAAKPPLLSRVWNRVKHEAAHYWHGSKLLVSEVRISSRLQWKILQGETLTRRERRQVGVCYSSLYFHCIHGSLAETNNSRPSETRSLCRFCYCAIHGIFASSSPQTLSEHVTFYI